MTIGKSEAAHRRGFSRGSMIELSVPLHMDWMGGLPPTMYLDRVVSLGVHAVEIQLPPTLTLADLDRWAALTQIAIDRGCAIALHAPLPDDQPAWPEVLAWLQQLAARIPFVLIVHGCTAPQPDPALAARTIAFARQILAALPPTVTLAIEQGWISALRDRPGATLRRVQRRWQQRQSQRPAGVGSGMGAASQPSARRVSQQATAFDPLDQPGWRHFWRRSGHYSATHSREATLAIVERIDRPNCVIAWDLAHDWLGGSLSSDAWRSIPAPSFLQRVGYVRLHDVSENGCDHWPLVVGNVPYASQLRTLLKHGFDGPVCLAVRYPAAVQSYGDRWQTLDRSLAVARQTLRLY